MSALLTLGTPPDPAIAAAIGPFCGCNNTLRERVTVTLGQAVPISEKSPEGVPAYPAPLTDDLDWPPTPLGFLADYNSIVGNLGDATDGWDSLLAEIVDAVSTLGALIDALDSPLGIFADVLSFLGAGIPADVAGAFSDGLTGGQAALDKFNGDLVSYQPATTPAPPTGGGGTGGGTGGGGVVIDPQPLGGGGGVWVPCDATNIECRGEIFLPF